MTSELVCGVPLGNRTWQSEKESENGKESQLQVSLARCSPNKKETVAFPRRLKPPALRNKRSKGERCSEPAGVAEFLFKIRLPLQASWALGNVDHRGRPSFLLFFSAPF